MEALKTIECCMVNGKEIREQILYENKPQLGRHHKNI